MVRESPESLLREAQQQLRVVEAQVRDMTTVLTKERDAKLLAEDRADTAERQTMALRALVETLSERLESHEADTLLEP